MARNRISDILLTNRFHVLDVSITIPPVLIPTFGFQTCTTPEMVVQYKSIKEGNYPFPRKVAERVEVGTITLENGSQILNSDFWDWISKVADGRTVKKNLLIIHFTNIDPTPREGGGSSIAGLVEFDFRVPAKAWLLKNCSPARYKPGHDFDAMGGAASIQSLDIEYEEFTEFNVGIG